MEHKPENINLTRKQAWELMSRYVCGGLNINGGETIPGMIRYEAFTGCLEILCENDWRIHNGRIKLAVKDPLGENGIVMYFHPDTLERDFETEAAEKHAEIVKSRRTWVMTQGRAHCHQVVNRLWDGERDDAVGRAEWGTE